MTSLTPTLLLLLASVATAAQAQNRTISIWPGAAPGSEHWTHQERTYEDTPVGTVIQNVVVPTLTAYLPEKSRATGTAVIIAPGGAFVALAMSRGGTDMATWLQQRGVAAFLLKYRTVEKKQDGIPNMDMDTAGRYGIADGIQALKVVRQRAKEFGVSPSRVGMIGFSAGAMVVSGALLQPHVESRPSFAAMIYGGPFGVMPKIPRDLPPTFMAWASDDQVALTPILRFHRALLAAKATPEVHTYRTGGHGFGVAPQGKDSDRWTTDFHSWLRARGYMRR